MPLLFNIDPATVKDSILSLWEELFYFPFTAPFALLPRGRLGISGRQDFASVVDADDDSGIKRDVPRLLTKLHAT
jgi:hypothetical protein